MTVTAKCLPDYCEDQTNTVPSSSESEDSPASLSYTLANRLEILSSCDLHSQSILANEISGL